MGNGELQYLENLRLAVNEGKLVSNRTGIKAFTVPHLVIQHDMELGFPLLTTKKMAFKSIKVELEGFINGITDKSWYQERGCRIWDEWCNPQKVSHISNPKEKKKEQLITNDLGPIYGSQWRRFNGSSSSCSDQLKTIIDLLKSNPEDRRMLCSAWNPLVLDQQALPPCHVMWHVTVIEDRLNLCWVMRSCDWFLGCPFNLASYGLLLHLLAKESGFKEGMLTGLFSNAHVYENHISAVNEQLERSPMSFPKIETNNFTSIFEWNHDDTNVIGYKSHPKISAEVAV